MSQKAKTGRRWMRALCWTALFLGAVSAGLWASSELAPERMRREAEIALSEVLGEVRVGSVSLGWSTGPAVTARHIEVSEEGEVALALAQAELGLDLLRIFRGGGRFDRLTLHGLELRLRRLPDGSLRPRRLNQFLRAKPPQTERQTQKRPSPRAAGLRVIEIQDGAILVSAERSDAAPAATLRLEDLSLRLAIGVSSRLDLHTRIGSGLLRIRGDGALSAGEFRVAAERLDLAGFQPWLDVLVPSLPELPTLQGELGFSFSGQQRRDGSLQIEHFSAELPAGSAGGSALPALRVSAEIEAGTKEIRIGELRFTADELLLHGEAAFPRDLGPHSPLHASISTQRISLEALKDHVATLGLDALQVHLTRLSGGSIDTLRLVARDLEWSALQDWPEAPGRWPDGLRLEAGFRGVEIGIDKNEPLREIVGRIEIDAAHLVLRDMEAKLGERPLPKLSLKIVGWPRFVEAGTAEPIAAVSPLLGRGALMRFVEANREAEPGWRSARLEFEWLDHPALLRPLERVAATLRPLRPGVEVDLHGARWGGVWVSGQGILSGEGSEERIALDLETHTNAPVKIGDPVGSVVRGAPVKRDGVHWSAGRAVVDLRRLGSFDAREVRGPFRSLGTRLVSEEVVLLLEPRGRVSGRLELDLSKVEAAHYRASFQLSDGDLSALLEDLGLQGELNQGHLVLATDLRGELRAGVPMLDSLRGPISAHSRDGVIRRRVPWALAIAAASDTFNPFRSRETLAYDAIDGSFRLDRGRVSAETLAATGPTLRMVATGSVQLAENYPLEAVVGLFFFRGIDKVIGSVPILNTLILGSDENLVPAYFSLEGPWAKPKARLIPMKSFLAGPANIVVEGVPQFVRGGINRLGNLFSLKPSGSSKTPAKSEADPASKDPEA